MLRLAVKLKHTSEIKGIFTRQLETPDTALVRFFFTQINPGRRCASTAIQKFTNLDRTALNQFINDRISSRLRAALADVTHAKKEEGKYIEIEDNGIVTTEEEIEGYHMVKAIVSEVVDPDRVIFQDAKSYMVVLLDDNRLKPIFRLHFNTANKYITQKYLLINIFSFLKAYEVRFVLSKLIEFASLILCIKLRFPIRKPINSHIKQFVISVLGTKICDYLPIIFILKGNSCCGL